MLDPCQLHHILYIHAHFLPDLNLHHISALTDIPVAENRNLPLHPPFQHPDVLICMCLRPLDIDIVLLPYEPWMYHILTLASTLATHPKPRTVLQLSHAIAACFHLLSEIPSFLHITLLPHLLYFPNHLLTACRANVLILQAFAGFCAFAGLFDRPRDRGVVACGTVRRTVGDVVMTGKAGELHVDEATLDRVRMYYPKRSDIVTGCTYLAYLLVAICAVRLCRLLAALLFQFPYSVVHIPSRKHGLSHSPRSETQIDNILVMQVLDYIEQDVLDV
jgi:hypothetical protein